MVSNRCKMAVREELKNLTSTFLGSYKIIGEKYCSLDQPMPKPNSTTTSKKNHSFDNLKIECKNTDKMSENEQHKFVSSYFKRHEFKM